VLIREDPLLVVDIHHSLCQPSARHSVVKERGAEKHRARIHERRKMIEGYGLRIDRAWKTVEEVAHAHGVEPRAVDGDRLQDIPSICLRLVSENAPRGEVERILIEVDQCNPRRLRQCTTMIEEVSRPNADVQMISRDLPVI